MQPIKTSSVNLSVDYNNTVRHKRLMAVETGDTSGDWKYKSCSAQLSGKYLSVTMKLGGNILSERNENLKAQLDRIEAVMIGDKSWVVRTELSPKQIVESIRRHLQGDDEVNAFTLSGDLAWAGPVSLCELFQQIGIAAVRCDDVPNPVDP